MKQVIYHIYIGVTLLTLTGCSEGGNAVGQLPHLIIISLLCIFAIWLLHQCRGLRRKNRILRDQLAEAAGYKEKYEGA